jgi:cell division protein ZapB
MPALTPLTRLGRSSILHSMATEKPTQTADVELNKLEYRLAELIQVCERLKEENRALRSQQESLTAERASLIEKNEMARVRVEAMINRLKSMEKSV